MSWLYLLWQHARARNLLPHAIRLIHVTQIANLFMSMCQMIITLPECMIQISTTKRSKDNQSSEVIKSLYLLLQHAMRSQIGTLGTDCQPAHGDVPDGHHTPECTDRISKRQQRQSYLTGNTKRGQQTRQRSFPSAPHTVP
jgi:hypothetical protein